MEIIFIVTVTNFFTELVPMHYRIAFYEKNAFDANVDFVQKKVA